MSSLQCLLFLSELYTVQTVFHGGGGINIWYSTLICWNNFVIHFLRVWPAWPMIIKLISVQEFLQYILSTKIFFLKILDKKKRMTQIPVIVRQTGTYHWSQPMHVLSGQWRHLSHCGWLTNQKSSLHCVFLKRVSRRVLKLTALVSPIWSLNAFSDLKPCCFN